jgi:predicted Zn finger-like uncharacterized protein
MAEVVNCPNCQRKLRVPEELLGKKVKCPTCSETFTATAAAGGGEAPPPPPPDEPPPRRPREDDIEEDRPSRRAPRRDDDRGYEDEPRRRRRPSGGYTPHRGTLILVFGILGLVVCGIFAPIAWVMGNTDMKEIREGRMDPEGESLTNIGRILGIVGTILLIIGFVCGIAYCGIVGMMGIGGAAGNR